MDLNVKTYTLKLSEKRRYLNDVGIGKDFVNRVYKLLTIKRIKLINCTASKLRTIKQSERQTTDSEMYVSQTYI